MLFNINFSRNMPKKLKILSNIFMTINFYNTKLNVYHKV